MLIQQRMLDEQHLGRLNAEDAGYEWSPSHARAAEWLRDVDTPGDDAVSTNRFCVDRDAQPPECGGPWGATYSWVGAVTGKQMFIEGYENWYGVQDSEIPDWAKERIDVARSFARQPDPYLQRLVWDEGVRWVWLDLTQPSAKDWEGFGTIEFENDAVRIVQLAPPSA